MSRNIPEAEGSFWLKVSIVTNHNVKEITADAMEFLECDVDSKCLIELFNAHILPILKPHIQQVEILNIDIKDVPGGRVITYITSESKRILVVLHRADTSPLQLVEKYID
ncbi:MAG: hypothetical protein DRO15_03680 [Thermoprotei archaeon]|nr:MAG: hypothetical protein DRO15_03680 [Thermoprotei archaeon]